MAGTTTTMKFLITGEDRNASATIKKVGSTAKDTSSSVSDAFSTLGSKIGGEVGELFSKLSEGIDSFGEAGKRAAPKIMAVGAVVTGLGAALVLAGSKEKQASDQLNQAITNAGDSTKDYADQIEEAVKQQENYGHSAAQTKDALAILVNQTGSTEQAIERMGLVANIAAARHISLADAATLVAQVLSGKGAKTLALYGIQLDKSITDPTQRADKALDQLSQKVQGQAAASVDNWSGRLEIARTKLEDFVGEVGQKAGPILVGFGGTIEAVGIIMETQLAQKAAGAIKGIVGIGDATVSTAGKIGRATAAMGALGLAVTAAVTIWNVFHHDNAQAKADIESLTNALQQDSDAVGANTRQWVANKLQTSGAFDIAKKYGIALNDVTDAALGNADAQSRVNAVLDAARKKNGGFEGDYDKLANTVGKTSGELGKAQVATKNLAETTDKAASSTTEATDALKDWKSAADDGATVAKEQSDAIDAMSAAFQRLNGNIASDLDQQVAWDQSLKGFTGDLAEHNRTLNQNTVAGRQNAQAIVDRLQKAEQDAVANVKNGETVAQQTAKYNAQVTSLENTARAAGLSKDQVAALIKQYHLTPAEVSTTMRVNAAPAAATLAWLNAQFDAASVPRYVDFIVQQKNAGVSEADALAAAARIAEIHGRPPGQASGGPAAAYATYRVNEHGTEYLTMGSQGGYITPAGRTPPGGGGVTVIVQTAVGQSPHAVASEVDKVIARARAQGWKPSGKGLATAG